VTRSDWLVSARFDAGAFVAPALGSLLLAAVGCKLLGPAAQTPSWAFLLLVVGIDVAHVHGTTLQVYCDGRELRRRSGLYVLVPVLGFAAASGAYAVSPGLFWRALAYLAVFHFMRQQIGWARLYRRRAGDRGRFDAWLDEATLYAAMLYPLLVWHARLPRDFAWFVQGDFITGLSERVARAASVPWALLLACFFARQLQRRARGEALRTGKLLLVVTTASTWWAGIVLFENDFAFTVTNVVAHGVPYMAMAYRVGRSRRRTAAPAWAWVFERLPRYAAALVLLAYAEEWLWDAGVWHEHPELFPAPWFDPQALPGLIIPLLALPQISHYVLDAFVWRLDGSNPGLARALGLRDRADASDGRVRVPTDVVPEAAQ
jgi:hypothetical protein